MSRNGSGVYRLCLRKMKLPALRFALRRSPDGGSSVKEILRQQWNFSPGKTAMSQQSTNFYATNFELGSISPLFIHQLSRSRWRIDTEVFHTITTDCHLKHPAVHQTTALVILTMIRFLAYTLSLVFYQRQVRSHARRKCETFHEFAKRLAYWFVALSPNTS